MGSKGVPVPLQPPRPPGMHKKPYSRHSQGKLDSLGDMPSAASMTGPAHCMNDASFTSRPASMLSTRASAAAGGPADEADADAELARPVRASAGGS